jgi:hypothetical protein
MRTGISVTVSSIDHARLTAVVRDRNAPQKHVWRARIVLLTADGLGTNAIMRETGKSKSCVWRWQERFAEAGVEACARVVSMAGVPCDGGMDWDRLDALDASPFRTFDAAADGA